LANLGYIDPRISVKPGVNSHQFGNDGILVAKIGAGGRWYPFKQGCMEGVFFEDLIDTDIWWTYSGNSITLGPVTISSLAWTIQNTFHVGYSWVTDIGFFADMAAGFNVEAPLGGIPTDTLKFTFYPTSVTTNQMVRMEARLSVGWAF
jgi:hypothetical protein